MPPGEDPGGFDMGIIREDGRFVRAVCVLYL